VEYEDENLSTNVCTLERGEGKSEICSFIPGSTGHTWGKDLLAILLQRVASDTLFGLASAQQFWRCF